MKPDDSLSLYERLAGALALDGQAARSTPELTNELEALTLPPLVLPPVVRRPSKRSNAFEGFLALAAAITLVVLAKSFMPFPSELDFGYRIKGSVMVQLYWERDGEVRRFAQGQTLSNGDRVLAEVMAPKPALAYWGVLNSRGELLGEWAQVKASVMELSPAKSATFPTSLRLVGSNEGETLFVLVCAKDGPDPFPELSSTKGGGMGTLAHCNSWKFQLR